MNPMEPPAELPRNGWPDQIAPPLPGEPTNPPMTPAPVAAPYTVDQPERRRWWSVARFRQIVFFLLSVLETLLIIRFFLKLLGANPDAAFTIFIYGVTEFFVIPFEGVFTTLQASGNVLDLATLLAMIVYALLAWLTVGAVETVASRRLARPT